MDTSTRSTSLNLILDGVRVRASELDPSERLMLVKKILHVVRGHLKHLGSSFFTIREWIHQEHDSHSRTSLGSALNTTGLTPVFSSESINLETRAAYLLSLSSWCGGEFVKGCGYPLIEDDLLLITQKGEFVKFHQRIERSWTDAWHQRASTVLVAEFVSVDEALLTEILAEKGERVIYILESMRGMISTSIADRKKWLEHLQEAASRLEDYKSRLSYDSK